MRHDQLTTRAATFDRALADPASRTVPASLSSEEPVVRFGATEVLRHEAASVNLERAAEGLPLLFSHDRTQPIGRVENVRLDGKRLVGTLRFGRSAKAAEVFQDVQDGVLRDVSIGYRVDATESTADGYVATHWTLYEVSVLAVPADISVGIGRGADLPNHHSTATIMNQHQQMTRAEVDDEIRSVVSRHGLPAAFAENLVTRQSSLESAQGAVLNELAHRSAAQGGHITARSEESIFRERQTNADTFRGLAHPGPDGRDARRELMVDALVARMGGAAVRGENHYVYARVADMARDCLELHGTRTTGMSGSQLIERALHTTSDFPNLLQSAGQRQLRQAYNAAPGIKRAFKSSTASDFRSKQKLNLGEAPALLQVNEHGEFKYGSMAEASSTYSLATFGRIFGISRQALVNDDLNAFGDMATRLGRAAAEFESQFLVTLLTSNPTMYDSVALFHASHSNLATGAGSVLQFSALGTARQSMRLQKGLDGTTPIDATPRYLIVPAALETTGEQLLTQIMAQTISNVNPFANKLELVVDPRLDAVSATAWYLAADPAVIDTIEYSYLDSAQGPEVITEEGFEVDGLRMKVRLDFGSGVLDFRGLYKANGS